LEGLGKRNLGDWITLKLFGLKRAPFSGPTPFSQGPRDFGKYRRLDREDVHPEKKDSKF